MTQITNLYPQPSIKIERLDLTLTLNDYFFSSHSHPLLLFEFLSVSPSFPLIPFDLCFSPSLPPFSAASSRSNPKALARLQSIEPRSSAKLAQARRRPYRSPSSANPSRRRWRHHYHHLSLFLSSPAFPNLYTSESQHLPRASLSRSSLPRASLLRISSSSIAPGLLLLHRAWAPLSLCKTRFGCSICNFGCSFFLGLVV